MGLQPLDKKMEAFGMWVGQTDGNNPAAFIETIESLPKGDGKPKDVIVAMEKDSGVSLSEFKVDGGMTGNSFLMQLIADLLGVKAVNIGLEEVSALGAAYMAGSGVGEFKSINDLASLHYSQKVFEPSEAAGQIQEGYDAWQAMIAKHC